MKTIVHYYFRTALLRRMQKLLYEVMSYKSSARSILATSLASLPSLDSAVLAFTQYLFKQGNLKGFDYSHNADLYQLTLKNLTLRSFKIEN